MIALIAFALLASTVSAQTANFWFYSGSANCNSTAAATVVNTTIPTNTCSLVNNTAIPNIYVKAVCNNVTGIVTVTPFSQDPLCNATSATTPYSSAAACNTLGASSFSIQNCTVVSPATASPTNPSNGTLAPTATPTPTPGNGTNAPTVKPGSASQQAGLSMIAAVAVMVIAML